MRSAVLRISRQSPSSWEERPPLPRRGPGTSRASVFGHCSRRSRERSIRRARYCSGSKIEAFIACLLLCFVDLLLSSLHRGRNVVTIRCPATKKNHIGKDHFKSPVAPFAKGGITGESFFKRGIEGDFYYSVW